MVQTDNPELAAVFRKGEADVLDPVQRRVVGPKHRRLEVPFKHPTDLRIFARKAKAMFHDIEAICSTGDPDVYETLLKAVARFDRLRAETAIDKLMQAKKPGKTVPRRSQ